MERAKIFQLLASSRGGAAVHLRALAPGLVQANYAVTAMMPLDGGSVTPEDFTEHGVKFIPWLYPSGQAIQKLRTLIQAFKNEAPDLIHVHGSRTAFWAYWALRWANLPRIPLIVTMHGFVTPFHRQPRRVLQLAMEQVVARRSTAIIAVAEAEREALLQANVAPPTKIFTVPLGFDLSLFTSLSAADRNQARETLGIGPYTWLLLTVCRLDRPRDFQTLLTAFRQLVNASPQARLFIVGGGPMQVEIEGLIQHFGLQEQVKMWGVRRDVTTFYAAADTFVLTSWGWEGLPITVIEAQAAGIPVVVTDAGGSKEACLPNRSSFLVPRSDPQALAEALQTLINNPTQRNAMGLAGRIFVKQAFKIDRMINQILSIYGMEK